MKRLLSLVLLSTMNLTPLIQSQTDTGDVGASQEEARDDVLGSDEIVIRRYVPHSMSVKDLYRNITDLRGRSIHIRERGGIFGRSISNLSTFENAVLVRDNASAVREILALMKELEVTLGEEQAEELHLLEFSPRFISLESASLAIAPFERLVRDPDSDSRPKLANVTVVGERNVMIMRDTPSQVTRMLELLTRLDVPEEQVRIRVWVAIGDSENQEMKGLPDDLVGDLSALLPGFGFRADGFSIVQASVAANRSVELEIEGADQDYALLMRPTAYDPESGRLTLGNFQFVRRARPTPPAQGATSVQVVQTSRVLFSTSAVLNAGDYTVLGASGRSPIFLVIKVEPLNIKPKSAR